MGGRLQQGGEDHLHHLHSESGPGSGGDSSSGLQRPPNHRISGALGGPSERVTFRFQWECDDPRVRPCLRHLPAPKTARRWHSN